MIDAIVLLTGLAAWFGFVGWWACWILGERELGRQMAAGAVIACGVWFVMKRAE